MSHYVVDARTATLHFPGIGRYVRSLVQALVPLLTSEEYLSVLTPPDPTFELPASRRAQAMPVAVTPFQLRQQWVIPGLLRQLSASLYHSAYYLMPYRPRLPTVLTLYDLIPMLLPGRSTARARLLFRWMTALALRTSQHCIAVSNTTRRDVVSHFTISVDDVTSIPLAADPAFRPQTAAQVTSLCRRLDLSTPLLLYLGSNKPHKNLVRLVEAWHRVTPAFSDHSLVIAGAWDARYPQARVRADQLGLGADKVRWLGPVTGRDLPALYAAATLFVFPSLYEGFGLPVLEAMACGTPVVCAAIPPISEVAGDAVLQFDPVDTDAMAEAIGTALSDAACRDRLRQAGLSRAADYSWTNTAQETLRVYRRVTRCQ